MLRMVLAAGAAAMMIFATTQAGAQSINAANNGPAIGVGIICNTSEQAGQFVRLRASGTEPLQAVEAVNAEMQDTRACGLAAVAFTRDKTVDSRTMGDQLVQIVRINVVAGFNGSAWQTVSGVIVQYAVMEGAGETI